MTWTLTGSLDEFDAHAGAYLTANPAANTVLHTVVDQLRRGGPKFFGDRPPVFGWWQLKPGAPIAGAFVQTPPFPVRLGMMPPQAGAELASLLASKGAELSGVGGGAAPARAFADTWQRLSGQEAVVKVEQRLYELGELVAPSPVPSGSARLAVAADRELLIRWFGDFAAETGTASDNFGPRVDLRTAGGLLLLWEDGGEAVSLAGISPVLAGMSRVGPVFTPPHLRGRGYASGVVAAGSAHAVSLGAAEVLLYTNLANPTANSIYQKLGYRAVEDGLVLDFT